MRFLRFKLATPLIVGLATFAFGVGSASAATRGPGWTIDSVPTPTNFFSSPSEDKACEVSLGSELNPCDGYEVSATNAGSAPTTGPVTLTDTLPPGVTVQKFRLLLVEPFNGFRDSGFFIGGTTKAVWPANETGLSAECKEGGAGPSEVRCTVSGAVAPDDWLQLQVYVTVNAAVAQDTRLTNVATVSGGGAPTVSTASENEVSQAPAPFGPSRFQFFKAGLNGSQETQAGAHPYELTTTIDLNNEVKNLEGGGAGKSLGIPQSGQDVRDIVVDLPLGFAGSTLAVPQCTEVQLVSEAHCPPDTVVGHLTTEPENPAQETTTINSPLWSLAPEHGHPAEFGYIDALKNGHVAGYVSVVPTPAGYVLRFVASQIPEVPLARIVVTFNGDPALRDAETQRDELEEKLGTPVALQAPTVQVPFFTNPTACSNGPQVATLWIDSWQHPAQFQPGSGGLVPTNLEEPTWKKMESVSPPVTGCDELSFTPEIGSQPTTHEADKPTGLEFEQRLPQTETVGVNATPALKDTTIVFPEGMTVDPSAADGLGTCSDAQIGWEGPTLFDFSRPHRNAPNPRRSARSNWKRR